MLKDKIYVLCVTPKRFTVCVFRKYANFDLVFVNIIVNSAKRSVYLGSVFLILLIPKARKIHFKSFMKSYK